jgi:two-component system, OmpR family, sensor histidine kinase TctE
VSSSISRRLILWLAVPLMLLALCGALLHYFNNVAPSVIDADRRLKAATSALIARVRVTDGKVDLDSTVDGRTPLPAPDSVRFTLRDAHRQLLFGDARLPSASMDSLNAQEFSIAAIEGRQVRMLTTRFDTRMGVIFISVADAHRGADSAARYGLMSTLLWDFVQLDVTLVLVWFGIQLGLRPIKKLREEIAARSALDLRPIVETSVPREIAPVVVTLNRLFKMLRSSAQSQQQFIANTAHQLRTPITGMQAQLNLLISDPAAQPVRERLLTLQEGARQLAHSANQLLTLARAEPSANFAPKNQDVDLKAIVGEIAAKFFDRALESDIDLGIDSHSATVHADPSLLDDLLSNLVDNALKYTPRKGAVTISSGVRLERPYLAVEDNGPGIPESERRLVRQRFYRLPNSPGHGSGLGLAIVDEIAKLYGAELNIQAGADGTGTRIEILFP